jgi:hypothetical protein
MTSESELVEAQNTNSLSEKLKSFEWLLPDQDDSSYEEIKRRIAATGKMRKLLTYSELVKGIDFNIPSISDQPFRIMQWTGLNRHIIGQFLGKLSCESYERYGFMANAMVVDAAEGIPSKSFFQWMEYVQAIPDKSETAVLQFWAEQVQKAQQHYRKYS